jgi:hypothetical protein
MPVTVQQEYNYNHTPEQSEPFIHKLDEMKAAEKFISVTFAEGDTNPTFTFADEASADEYVAFMSNLNPVSTTITPV